MIDIYYLKNRRSIKSNQESNNYDFLSLWEKKLIDDATRLDSIHELLVF